MAFIYDLSDTWNNAGISFSGIKINVTDSASAAGSKLLDLQIGSASKFTVGKTGTVTATGLIESTTGGFKFPDGTTQTTKATVNSVSGTGTVNGITLTGTVTDSGSLTLGGTLGNIANSQLTNSAITINGTSTALGGSIAVGTVTSVAGTGTVNGLTLTGSVTTSGSLTLGGTLGNIANSQLTNSAITINGTSTALGGSISVGTVTSVAALTLGTSGTDLASSVANGTTTPVITLNVPTASATNRGALSSSDWSTFNAKQAALVSGTNIKTVGGASLLGSGDVGTIGLAYGGTGATTASGARTALGLGTAAVLNAGVAGGVATLDGSGTVPTSQLPGAVLGGLNYQGTWNASTNTPTLASSTGSKGHYYVVSVAGSTNLNGITDWKIGDWAVYDGTTWQKVDNTDAVSSVNGFTGAVVLTTSDVAQGTNLYFTQAAARGSVSAGTGISYDSGTGVITNSAPDQTVALTGAGTTTVTGTYPNFTITSNDSTVGTVTSVAASGGTTGLSFTGSPITSSGTLTLGGTLALASGGTGATTASGARTALELGTAATTDASAYATAAQGAKADTAVQTIASTDGSVTITGTTAIDLSVAVAGSTSNVLLPVRNTTGATLTKGTAVYISGATGQLSTVSKAIATGDATSAQTLGLVTANISNNSNGNVTLIGTITNIDTSAYTDGQQLYLSPTTAGTLTGTKPYAPSHLVYMAVVESAHPSQGKLFVKVQNGYEMDELHDVSAQSPSNGQTLVYNSTTDLWEKNTVSLTAGVNGTLPVANGGTGATTLSSGYLVKGNGTSAVSASVVYDDGTNVGIGTSTPDIFGRFYTRTVGINSSGTSILQINGTTYGGIDLGFNGTRTATMLAETGGFYLQTVTAAAMSLGTNGLERMRIDSSGNVGIGTSSPAYPLQVRRAGGAGSLGISIDGVGATDRAVQYFAIQDDAAGSGSGHAFYYRAPSSTTDTLGLMLDEGGNVGIGTNSPGGRLQVDGNFIRYGNSASYTSDEFLIQRAAAGVNLSVRQNTNMILLTNDIERMRIDTSGNVGLGVTPSAWGASRVAIDMGANSYIGGILQTNTTTNIYYDGSNWRYKANGPAALSQMYENFFIWQTVPNGTGGGVATLTEAMRLTGAGNLGIGTSSPVGKLTTVSTSAFAAPNLLCTDNVSNFRIVFNTGTYAGVPANKPWLHSYDDIYVGSDANTAFNVMSGGVNTFKVDSSGNVGVGTSTPLLTASGRGNVTINGSSDSILTFGIAGSYSSYIYSGPTKLEIDVQGARPIQFNTNDTERMRIDASGNLLVAKSAVQAGAVGAEFRSDGGATVSRSGTTSATSTLEVYSTGAGAYRFYVDMSGTIGATNTSISAISDIRLKENVRDLDAGLDAILALKPRRFDWKEGKGKDVKDDMGFIAQEVETVLPALIGGWKAGEGEPDDLKSVKAGDLIPVLVKAIQELTARVAQLEGN